MTTEKAIWIVQRHPERRAALVRLVSSRLPLVSGAPGDPLFDSNAVAEPRAIVLGLEGDFERELDFAHHSATRFGGRRWVLICDPDDEADARRLFDTLRPHVLVWPPDPRQLGALLAATVQRDSVVPLSARRRRETTGERFTRWFGGEESAGLLQILDPRTHGVSALLRGERGTGRDLVARYLHAFGPKPHSPFLRVDGSSCESPTDLLESIRAPGDTSGDATVFLADADHLPNSLQATLADWIAFGPPHATALDQVRWVASVGPAGNPADRFDARLERQLSGLVIPLQALRFRPLDIERFVEATLAAWAEQQRQRPPVLREDARAILLAHPWTGNLAELESVLLRSLVGHSAEDLGAPDLRFENDPIELQSLPTITPPLAVDPLPLDAPPFDPLPVDPLPLDAPPEAPHPSVDSTPAVEIREEAPDWNPVVSAAHRAVQAPLESIRTFTDRLPEPPGDTGLRERFDEDVERIQEVIAGLRHLGDLQHPTIDEIDLAELLQRLANACIEVLAERQVFLNTEIDRDVGRALTDPRLLEYALAGLVQRALDWLPDDGELFLASHHQPGEAEQDSRARILLRFQAPLSAVSPESTKALERVEGSFEFVAARTIIEALGGTFTLSSSGEREILILVDLPAPSAA